MPWSRKNCLFIGGLCYWPAWRGRTAPGGRRHWGGTSTFDLTGGLVEFSTFRHCCKCHDHAKTVCLLVDYVIDMCYLLEGSESPTVACLKRAYSSRRSASLGRDFSFLTSPAALSNCWKGRNICCNTKIGTPYYTYGLLDFYLNFHDHVIYFVDLEKWLWRHLEDIYVQQWTFFLIWCLLGHHRSVTTFTSLNMVWTMYFTFSATNQLSGYGRHIKPFCGMTFG